MRTMSAVIHSGTKANEQMMNAKGLISRVELLMSDERYPPLYTNIQLNLKIPFLIKYRRP